MLRRLLDGVYLAAGALAALCLVAIGLLVLASIGTRLFDTFVPGLSAWAGYAMAASSFLALAYTFSRGGHIRVKLVLDHVRGAPRRGLELWCLGAGTALAGYLAWYLVKMVLVSYELGDLSEGADATPLWIPQAPMALGAAILALAVADRFVCVALGAELAEPVDPAALE